MLGKLTIRQKLLASFSFVILMLLILLAAALSNMSTVSAKIHDMTEDRYPKIALASSITIKSMDVGRQIRSAVIFSAGDTEEYLSKVDSLNAARDADMDKMEVLLSTPKGKELFAGLKSKLVLLRAALAESYPLIRSHKTAEAAQVVKLKIAPANNSYMASLKDFLDFQEDLMRKGIADTEDSSHQAMTNMLLVAGIALVLAVVNALVIARLISVPLQKSALLVSNIQRGDLSGSDEPLAPSRDEALEIARGVQDMRRGLRDVVQAIQLNARNVSDSARELSSMAEEVAGSTQRQAEATSEAAATIEQLTVSINHVADNSDEASRQAKDTGSLARAGGKEVDDSVTLIQEVSQAVSGTSTQMDSLTDEIRQIGSIVTVIREVADQTNLLALNAAIEAARAGESGRGFAVVADEVRKLAERTTSSAAEITQMINSIQQGVERVVGSMSTSLESVNGVCDSAELASRAIERIGSSTHVIEQSIGNITAALGEQRIASQSLAQNMERVSQMAEGNSATVEQLATTSSQLSELSRDLQEITARFRL